MIGTICLDRTLKSTHFNLHPGFFRVIEKIALKTTAFVERRILEREKVEVENQNELIDEDRRALREKV